MRSPALRTLPSSTWLTPSASAIRRMSVFCPLNANADVRAITFRPGICASALMISSARPSLKYSLSLSAAHVRERQHGDRRARVRAAGDPRDCSQRRLDVGHRLEPVRRRLRAGTASTIRRAPASVAAAAARRAAPRSRPRHSSRRRTRGRPHSISYSTAPKLKMSDRASSGLPCACSGDMYAAVPSTVPSMVCVTSADPVDRSFARPKSSSLADPVRVTRMLAGFRSRCRIPLLCAASSAPAICIASAHRVLGRQRAAQRRAVDVLHHQVVRADVVQRADVRMVQRGDRARLLLETIALCSPFSCLMATMRSRRVSRAFQTSPMPPAPSADRISYGPRRAPA